MDILRSHMLAPARLLADSEQETFIRWYPARRGAKVFPGWHAFASPVWEDPRDEFDGPGVFYAGQEFRPKRYPSPAGQHFHGQLEWFLTGLPESELGKGVPDERCGVKQIIMDGGVELGGAATMPAMLHAGDGGVELDGEGDMEPPIPGEVGEAEQAAGVVVTLGTAGEAEQAAGVVVTLGTAGEAEQAAGVVVTLGTAGEAEAGSSAAPIVPGEVGEAEQAAGVVVTLGTAGEAEAAASVIVTLGTAGEAEAAASTKGVGKTGTVGEAEQAASTAGVGKTGTVGEAEQAASTAGVGKTGTVGEAEQAASTAGVGATGTVGEAEQAQSTCPALYTGCSIFSGGAKFSFTFTLSGITNASCSSCSVMNTTFTLTATTGCEWDSQSVSPCGVSDHWALTVSGTRPTLTVRMKMTAWARGYGYSGDWDGQSSLTLSRIGLITECGSMPSTITLTPV